jgi:hypothetical protein
VSSDSRSDDPFQPAAGTDDVTSTYPVAPAPAPAPAEAAPPRTQSAWAAPVAPTGGSDPFDRPVATAPGAAAPVGAAPVRGKGGSGMLVNVLLAIALVVAVGGVAFAVGRVTAPATTASGRTGFGANGQGGFQPNASGAPGGGFNGGFGAGNVSIQGTVTAVSADSITIQLAGGQSITIPTNAQTTYRESQASTAAAVKSGTTVMVQLPGGRGAFGNGNGNGGQGGGPNASGAPGRTLGPASTITVIPAGG